MPQFPSGLVRSVLVATYTVLCVSVRLSCVCLRSKDNEILYVGFEVVAHVPCCLSEALMLLFYPGLLGQERQSF